MVKQQYGKAIEVYDMCYIAEVLVTQVAAQHDVDEQSPGSL